MIMLMIYLLAIIPGVVGKNNSKDESNAKVYLEIYDNVQA